ncbi:hypothetical protein Rs2_35549 [Raphanus sativus]|nr:hypothetical protein Rs2_35549 [Raphanus sativus]
MQCGLRGMVPSGRATHMVTFTSMFFVVVLSPTRVSVPTVFSRCCISRKMIYGKRHPEPVYRLYQVTRAVTFVQRLMFMMKDASTTVEITERGVALVGLVVTLQFLAVLCLWSLITFLMRLFPSRPVAENY